LVYLVKIIIFVKTGLKDGELIVTGRFRVLSKELQHGMKVKYEDETSSN
jgi:hypothetical protein